MSATAAEAEFDPATAIAPPNAEAQRAAAERQPTLTKPPGALGTLETLAITLAGQQGTPRPSADRVAVLVFAADHGITQQGVSPFPREVTAQMVANFANGGAAISVMARALDAELSVIDVGVDADLSALATVQPRKVRRGTRDMTVEAAITDAECTAAMAAGAAAVDAALASDGGRPDVLVFGEMGIGNTSAAAALTSALTGAPAMQVTGRGTGLDEPGVQRKADLIASALRLHGLDATNASDAGTNARRALRCVGGLEIAAIAGGMIHAARNGVPTLVDGFIATAAALAATRMNAGLRPC